MNLTDTRRQNLRIWTAEHGTPSKEKSLFSQLKGSGSFGEKVARRLESEYNMGAGYLDRPIDPNAAVQATGAKAAYVKSTRTSRGMPRAEAQVNADVLAEMNVITPREAQLLNWFRMCGDDSKEVIEATARAVEKLPLTAIRDDQAQSGSAGA